MWELLGSQITRRPDQVEHQKRRDAHGSIDFRLVQILQGVYDDLVRRCSRVEAGYAHQCRDLSCSNRQSAPCDKSRDGCQGDQVDDPATANEANEEYDGAANHGQR